MTGDMFIYPLAFQVGFRLHLHPIVLELLKQYNVSPHRVIPNIGRVLAVVPSHNTNLGINLQMNELLSVFCCKFFVNGKIGVAARKRDKWHVEETPRQSKKEWSDLVKISDWHTLGKEDEVFKYFSKS